LSDFNPPVHLWPALKISQAVMKAGAHARQRGHSLRETEENGGPMTPQSHIGHVYDDDNALRMRKKQGV